VQRSFVTLLTCYVCSARCYLTEITRALSLSFFRTAGITRCVPFSHHDWKSPPFRQVRLPVQKIIMTLYSRASRKCYAQRTCQSLSARSAIEQTRASNETYIYTQNSVHLALEIHWNKNSYQLTDAPSLC